MPSRHHPLLVWVYICIVHIGLRSNPLEDGARAYCGVLVFCTPDLILYLGRIGGEYGASLL